MIPIAIFSFMNHPIDGLNEIPKLSVLFVELIIVVDTSARLLLKNIVPMDAPTILSPFLNCALTIVESDNNVIAKLNFRIINSCFFRRVNNKYNSSVKTGNIEIFFQKTHNGLTYFPLPLNAFGKTEFSVYF